jgi:peroxiredoxin Q/BCP
MSRSLAAVTSALAMFAAVVGITTGAWRATAQEAAADAAAKEVALKVGDEAPAFEAVDDSGEPWKSIDHVGKKIMVVYFYPKDMTPGCTAQACSYRDSQAQFVEQGVEVIGVSGDTVESHQGFKKEHELNFTLLADPKGDVAKAFGVKVAARGDAIFASRWTFVIDQEGHIAYKDESVRPDQDVTNVLKVIAELKKKDA